MELDWKLIVAIAVALTSMLGTIALVSYRMGRTEERLTGAINNLIEKFVEKKDIVKEHDNQLEFHGRRIDRVEGAVDILAKHGRVAIPPPIH